MWRKTTGSDAFNTTVFTVSICSWDYCYNYYLCTELQPCKRCSERNTLETTHSSTRPLSCSSDLCWGASKSLILSSLTMVEHDDISILLMPASPILFYTPGPTQCDCHLTISLSGRSCFRWISSLEKKLARKIFVCLNVWYQDVLSYVFVLVILFKIEKSVMCRCQMATGDVFKETQTSSSAAWWATCWQHTCICVLHQTHLL